MGMYTQVRGWLNIGSIGSHNLTQVLSTLNQAREEFRTLNKDKLDRLWVCEDCMGSSGSNGSAWIFIGSEHKNYDDSMDEWIKHLLKAFPTAEGRIDWQYEEEDPKDRKSTSRYLLIYRGKIIDDNLCPTWCEGYGNGREEGED